MKILNSKWFNSFIKRTGDRWVQTAELTPQSLRRPTTLNPIYNILPLNRKERREQSRRKNQK
jgi:hypothetical protein